MGVHCLLQDEFQRYMRKKVICLDLSTLKFPISKNPEEPLLADRHSIINQAVLKPELKVSDLKTAMLWNVFATQEQYIYCKEVLKINAAGWLLQLCIKESESCVGTYAKP